MTTVYKSRFDDPPLRPISDIFLHFPGQPADLQKEVVVQPDNNPTLED